MGYVETETVLNGVRTELLALHSSEENRDVQIGLIKSIRVLEQVLGAVEGEHLVEISGRDKLDAETALLVDAVDKYQNALKKIQPLVTDLAERGWVQGSQALQIVDRALSE